MKDYLIACTKTCQFRINAAIAALVPTIDYAQTMLPMLRDYLPKNMYAAGFVTIILSQVLLHFRAQLAKQQTPPEE